MLVAPPDVVPSSRRRGYSGITSVGDTTMSGGVTGQYLQLALVRRLRSRDAGEDEVAELAERTFAPELPVLGHVRRREHDAMPDHRQEKRFDVLGRDDGTALEQRPRACRAFEG